MSALGLQVFQLPFKALQSTVACSGLRAAWSQTAGHSLKEAKGDCVWGYDNIAMPCNGVRDRAGKWVETDEGEYEDEEK